MTIRLRMPDPAGVLGEWLIPAAPGFLKTDVYDTLLLDLRRYTNGEVPGRSYLIAGHRGSGKTSLVARAVRDLRIELLERSVGLADEPGARGALVRPLLVKLYGPSLVKPIDPTKTELAAAKAKADAGAPADEGDESAVLSDVPSGLTQSALIQITIALYRELAREVSQGYAAHAREYGLRRGGEAIELAAQLALELDTVTPPATLRSFWDRLDRLRLGTLWPQLADHKLAKRALFDQGVREIIAVSTAGQAFEVCSGVVTFTVTEKKSDTHTLDVNAKGKSDLTAMIARLGTLGLGAATTAATWQSSAPISSVGLGALVWLLGSAGVSWSMQHRRSNDRKADYTFLRDRSVQTLDRELPLVIRRVREAGLAPVFVVDELDKLEDPQRQIGDIIKHLKHIVTDHGFFCFLADRTYFDYVERLTLAEAFPTEHTYFSERRLVAYSPGEITRYVAEEVSATDGDANEQFACAVFAVWVTHRAKLNFTAVMRELGRVASAGDRVAERIAELPSKIDVQLATTVQLAIDVVLNDEALARRISLDSGFAQLAHDALYAISRRWEADASEYDASRDALKVYLDGRLRMAVDAVETTLKVEEPDLDLLLHTNKQLIELLSDFAKLRARLQAGSDVQKALAAIVPTRVGALLKRKPGGKSQIFQFNFDCFGRDVRPGRGDIDRREVEDLTNVLAEFDRLLAGLSVSVTNLTAAGLLPATLTDASLKDAAAVLATWSPAAFPDKAMSTAIERARTLRAALNDEGERLALGLMIARRLLAAEPGDALSKALDVLARYPVLGVAGQAAFDLSAWRAANKTFAQITFTAPLSGDGDAIRAWIEEHFEAAPKPRLKSAASSAPTLWEPWPARLLAALADAPPINAPPPIGWGELVAAMRGHAPTAWLALDLGRVSRLEWSRIALAALPARSGYRPPRSVLIAALASLGFPRAFLMQLATAKAPDFSEASAPDDIQAAVEIAKTARERAKSGLLVVLLDDAAQSFNAASSRAMLYVRRSDLETFDVGLNWLQSLNAFAAVLNENEHPQVA